VKIYGKQNVFDAALDRIRWLFDEFPNIIVSISGGKDSTVVFHLALQVAREKNRLPLKVLWLDQEAEWQATVDAVRAIMEHPDVQPFWYQMPIRLFNATSTIDHWLDCWAPDKKGQWMRPKETYSIHENTYGTDRFSELFDAVIAKDQPPNTANIGGVRTEESPSRAVGLTHQATYKWATWGKALSRGKGLNQYTFYPIYDWSYLDVWKAIHSNGWSYNRIYDVQHQYGVGTRDMRVSNVHHETAVGHLFRMQEIEPDTYERLTQRIGGIDTAGKLGKTDYFVRELPFMFRDWPEYRDYLCEKLIANPVWRARFAKKFVAMDALYSAELGPILYRAQINAILTNDWEFVRLNGWASGPRIRAVKERHLGKTSSAGLYRVKHKHAQA